MLLRANVGALRRSDEGAVIHVRRTGGKGRVGLSLSTISTAGKRVSRPSPSSAPPPQGIGRLPVISACPWRCRSASVHGFGLATARALFEGRAIVVVTSRWSERAEEV